MTIAPNTYYKTNMPVYGECFIKALPNQMLCVCKHPSSIFKISGLMDERGSIQIKQEDFDSVFDRVKLELLMLKNT